MDFRYIKRVFVEPDRSYFLFGPRGTGKSTMTAKNNPDALTIDLRLTQMRYRLAAEPDELKDLVMAQPEGATIIIDEIQKIPELLPIVHLLIEKKKNWRFILTGSSARKLKRQGVDLLGGRALKKILHPFMGCELKEFFNLDEGLRFGLLPLRFGQPDPFETLQAYISLYLEEEVKAEGLIRHYEQFARFLQIMSLSHGNVINVTNIARECYVKRTTVNDWISILEDLLICYHISIFTQRAQRDLAAHPKFYFFDAGVFRALRPRSIKDSESELDGAALEGLVAQHLIAWRDYTAGKHDLFFWRTRSGIEVDFVLLGDLGFWAVEVKNATTVRAEDVKSLVEFKKDYPEAQPFLIYRGSELLIKNGITCVPAERFFKQLTPNKVLLP
jgi:predicted AAA+ superfamily ATPase